MLGNHSKVKSAAVRDLGIWERPESSNSVDKFTKLNIKAGKAARGKAMHAAGCLHAGSPSSLLAGQASSEPFDASHRGENEGLLCSGPGENNAYASCMHFCCLEG